MSGSFAHRFSPIAIGSYTLKNGIVNTGHAARFRTGDGLPDRRCVDCVGERSMGGIGIAVTGHRVPYLGAHATLSLARRLDSDADWRIRDHRGIVADDMVA